jgi:hypothetical protein
MIRSVDVTNAGDNPVILSKRSAAKDLVLALRDPSTGYAYLRMTFMWHEQLDLPEGGQERRGQPDALMYGHRVHGDECGSGGSS